MSEERDGERRKDGGKTRVKRENENRRGGKERDGRWNRGRENDKKREGTKR